MHILCLVRNTIQDVSIVETLESISMHEEFEEHYSYT